MINYSPLKEFDMPVETTPSKEILLQQTIDRFWETIPPLWSRIRSHLRSTAAEHFGITVEQFHILRHIHRGKNSVCELAAVIGHQPAGHQPGRRCAGTQGPAHPPARYCLTGAT